MSTSESLSNRDTSEMQQFKELVFSEEHHALSNLEGRLDKVSAASYLGSQLPRALAESHSCASKELVESLKRPIVDAVKESAAEDHSSLSSALSPIIGPATGLYMRGLLEGLIARSLRRVWSVVTLRPLRWRIVATLTRQSYADYAANKTGNYEVDQLLLVDAKNAKLLQQVAWVTDKELNTDIGEDILEAIRDYVKDELNGESLDGLEEKKAIDPGQLTFGEHNISVEADAKTILAAIGAGSAPGPFRIEMRRLIEAHSSESLMPAEREGSHVNALSAPAPTLESLLLANRSPKSKEESPWPLRLVVGSVAVATLGLIAFNGKNEYTWQQHVDQLRATPGIEVIQESRSLLNSKSLLVLQDPLARQAADVLSEQGEALEKINLSASLYHSGDPELVALRDSALKNEMATLATNQEHEALNALVQSVQKEQNTATQLIGDLTEELFFERFDPRREAITLNRASDRWKVSGTVSYQQITAIKDAESRGRLFSGHPADLSELKDDTDEKLLALKNEIDATSIHFESGSAKVSSQGKGDRVRLYKLIDAFEALHQVTGRAAPKYTINASSKIGTKSSKSSDVAFDRIESELNQLRLFEYRTSDITTAPELDAEAEREGVWLTAEPTLTSDYATASVE